MEVFDRVMDVLNEMYDDDLVEIWNAFCDKSNYVDDIIYPMCELDDYVGEGYPTDILDRFCLSDFNADDNYFKDGIYGIESVSSAEYFVEREDIADYIVRHDEDFGNEKIREALDEEEEEDEEE